MNSTVLSIDSLRMCPNVKISNFPETRDIDKAADWCWTCGLLCCCFPLCYPCYLSRTTRKRYRVSNNQEKYPQTKKRSEKGQSDYRDCKSVDVSQWRGTSTMSSEKSTGTRGYATILSRKDTTHTVLPNVQPSKVQEVFMKKIENTSRKDIYTLFITSREAAKFLEYNQSSQLLHGTESYDVIKPLKEQSKDDKFPSDEIGSLHSSESSMNSSYNLSRSFLQWDDDISSSEGHSVQRSLTKRVSFSDTCSERYFPFDNDLQSIAEEDCQVFKPYGHVSVAEPGFSAKIHITAETDIGKLQLLNPMLISSAYCNQLPLMDLIVIVVGKEDLKELGRFPTRGLNRYISNYWSGFFPALLVGVGWTEVEENEFVDTLNELFCTVEMLLVKDVQKCAGQVFSTVARMLSRMEAGGLSSAL